MSQTVESARRLDSLLGDVTLPSLPHVLLEIYDALASEVAGLDQVVRLLETDSGLTARTLRLANSAYYGMPRRISTVAEAILRIGAFDLWWLLFTTEVKSLFFGIDERLLDMQLFWSHSLYVACASRRLAERRGAQHPEELFVGGLLHDVGKLVLVQRMPVEYGEILEQVAAGAGPLPELETAGLGFSHAEVGGALLARWELPALFERCASTHHAHPPATPEAEIVAWGNRLAHRELDGEALDLPALPQELIDDVNRLYERLVAMIL